MSAFFAISFLGNLNRNVFEFFFGFAHRSPFLDAVGVFFAIYLPYLLILGAIVFLFEQRGTRRRLFFLFEALLSILLARGIITEIIHYAYLSLRPADVLGITPLFAQSGSSFPSGHAALFFALAVTIFFYSRNWGIWCILAAVVIGVARIFAGVHWPLDIMGGLAIGVASAAFVHTILRSSFDELYHHQGVAHG